MHDHEIISAAFQKYFSALKALDTFGKSGSFFDDVSSLDTFFSEFRNITFVIQEAVKTEDNKKTYQQLRDKYLLGDNLDWLKKARNKTTKQRPFQLQKELVIDIYLPDGLYRLKGKELIVDFDVTFTEILESIKKVFLDDLGLHEVSFSSRIIFREEGEVIDFYPRIRDGLEKMHEFLAELATFFSCDCSICTQLKEKTKKLYALVQCKEMTFVNDYSLELGGDISIGEQAGFYMGNRPGQFVSMADMRLSLDNYLFSKVKDCLRNLFLKFASMHMVIFRMQHQMMPVFMVVYRDQTYRMMPFAATTRATFYRNALGIAELADFADVEAVFFCGEYYGYDPETYSSIAEQPYTERIETADREWLSFAMLTRTGSEMILNLDEAKIEDDEYLAKQFQSADWSTTDIPYLQWLNPIRQSFSKDQ